MAAKSLSRRFFETHFLECARELIGCEIHWGDCSGRIVETEAYAGLNDEACHTFNRAAAREFVATQRPGTAYVYLTYGVHWLLNVLVKGGGQEGLVLIRALEPIAGLDTMAARRGTSEQRALCSGPGKVGQALGLTGADHGRDLCGEPRYGFRGRSGPVEVVADRRIGISRAIEYPWRFLERDSRYVSVKAGRVPLVKRGGVAG